MTINKAKLGWYVINRITGFKNLPRPTRVLGQGLNGIVFNTKKGTLLKFVYGRHPREYKALNQLKNTGITPGLYKSLIVSIPNKKEMQILKSGFGFNSTRTTNKLTIIEMNKLNAITLHDYIKKMHHKLSPSDVTHLKNMIKQVAKQMWKKGVLHGDLHPGNIMVTVDPTSKKVVKMWFIDFGRSQNLTKTLNPRNVYMKMQIASLFSKRVRTVPVYGPNGTRSNVNMLRAMYNINAQP